VGVSTPLKNLRPHKQIGSLWHILRCLQQSAVSNRVYLWGFLYEWSR